MLRDGVSPISFFFLVAGLKEREKRERKDKNRAENRARLMARSEEQEALKRAAAATVEA